MYKVFTLGLYTEDVMMTGLSYKKATDNFGVSNTLLHIG